MYTPPPKGLFVFQTTSWLQQKQSANILFIFGVFIFHPLFHVFNLYFWNILFCMRLFKLFNYIAS